MSDQSPEMDERQALDLDLSALLDGELEESRAQALRARMQSEPALADRFAELAAVNETLRELAETTATRERVARMRVKLQRRLAEVDAAGDCGSAGASELAGAAGHADERATGGGAVIPLRRPARWMAPLAAALAAGLALYLGLGGSPEEPPTPLDLEESAPSLRDREQIAAVKEPVPAPEPRAVTPGAEALDPAPAEVAEPIELARHEPEPSALETVSDEEIVIALEYEMLTDYDVIEQLEVLELLASMDKPM